MRERFGDAKEENAAISTDELNLNKDDCVSIRDAMGGSGIREVVPELGIDDDTEAEPDGLVGN